MLTSGASRRENAESYAHACHAPRRRGIQYAAASRLKQLATLEYWITRIRG
jgi:hypothetical protein